MAAEAMHGPAFYGQPGRVHTRRADEGPHKHTAEAGVASVGGRVRGGEGGRGRGDAPAGGAAGAGAAPVYAGVSGVPL